ncbi:hypothetical protein RJ639_023851 [Escallonia herrerae]|uniref:Uncharacterized protein n=1 Tax=Escallonia herrerae TaxID=1293975 RepID=A0AA88V226_9ASTE|nr:hypothetical protein RJ639_023851 [Escallonia herrerae]
MPAKNHKDSVLQVLISLNPEPFNEKEHATKSMAAQACKVFPTLVHIFSLLKAYYKYAITLAMQFALDISVHVISYGLAEIFVSTLVDHNSMWCPETNQEIQET